MPNLPNLYIDLGLCLDPAIIDPVTLEKDLRCRIDEIWNKQIHIPGSQNKQRVQYAYDAIPRLKRLNLPTLAREASVEKMKELRRDIGNLRLGGDITEDRFKKKLIPKYKNIFKEETLRHESGMAAVVRTTDKDVPKPVKPQTLKCTTTVSLIEMESITNDLSIVGGNPSDLYELLGVPRTTAIEKLYKISKDANDINLRQVNKTAEVDAKNRLYGKCLTCFKTKDGKAKYDAALYRFPFDLLAKTEFELRWNKEKKVISPQAYYVSCQDAIQAGYTPAEAEYLVYDFYVEKKKCKVPKEFIPELDSETVCATPTFLEFLGRLIRLVHESEKYNSTNPIGEALQHLREKLVGLRQSKHLSDIQIQCEVQSLFGDLQKWRKNDRTHTGQFWIVTQWSRWKELDVNTLKHAGNYPDLASLSAFHQDITMLLGTIQ